MPEDTYRQSWNRRNRGLLTFLLDQSDSMQAELQIDNSRFSIEELATGTLNSLIFEIIEKTPADQERGGIKDYCDILVLGYGDQVQALLHDGQGRPISIRELDAMRTRLPGKKVIVERFAREKRQKARVQIELPCWVDTNARSDYTEMAKALRKAYQVIDEWLHADRERRGSFPPIVVNITDGDNNSLYPTDPVEEATRIRNDLFTDDGHVLLFNCHLTAGGGHGQQGLAFPKSKSQIDKLILKLEDRDWAKDLFDMSSVIPSTMINKARKSYKFSLEDGARGFLYNASPLGLLAFLEWGTQPGGNS